MKWVFRLGFVLIPFLFFLSQNAYPHGFVKRHARITSSRAPASVDSKSIRGLTELVGRHSLMARPLPPNSGYFSVLAETLRKNATPSLPIEGSGIGAQVAVLHFAE